MSEKTQYGSPTFPFNQSLLIPGVPDLNGNLLLHGIMMIAKMIATKEGLIQIQLDQLVDHHLINLHNGRLGLLPNPPNGP
jgi:hypothetical protein